MKLRNHRRRRSYFSQSESLEVRAMLTPGANLALYEFTSNTSSNQDFASTDVHTESVASDLSSPLSLGFTGLGSPPNGLALGGAFNESIEPTPVGGQPDYFQFTITPSAGNSLNVSAFSLQIYKFTPGAKDSFSVYFDESPGAAGDNFSTKLLTGKVTSDSTWETFSVDLEALPELESVSGGLTFRIYVWGTVGVETMRFDNIRVQTRQETVSESALAYYGGADRLIHPLDVRGNRIPDFSTAGYQYGNAPLPDVATTMESARIVTVLPIAGDDTANLQAAIDRVSAMEVNANGFRGVVQLTAGEFQIGTQLQILASGVVLRGVGDGDNSVTETILRGTGTGQRSLIVVGEASGFASGISNTTHNIVDKYVPVGATSFEVDSTTNWNVGDEVVVRRPSTAEWITAIGMDMIPERSDGGEVTQWVPGGNFDQSYERVIERIEGHRIFLNAPITNSIDQQYGVGTVYRYTFPRINNVGIEDIRGVSDFAFDTDENHAWTFIELQAVENAWVTNVTGQHFGYATVHATSRSRMVTVDDAVSLDPKSIITGARRYPFVIDGQFTLMKNLYSEHGRHDFVNNSAWRNRGPNVFLNGTAVNSHSSTGPHQRWSTGTLYDTIVTDNQIEARNRGNFGSGHGWGGANMVFWNTTANSYIVQNPQTAQNWIIGGTGPILDETRFGPQPPPTVDAHNTPIDFARPDNPTSSLFVAQHIQRTIPGLERREYLLGDFDLGEFDGANSADAAFVDSDWQAAVTAMAAIVPVSDFDSGSASQFVPGSFDFELAAGEGVAAAVLTLGLRGIDGDHAADGIGLESTEEIRLLSALGITSPLQADATTVLTIELTDADLLMLQDGVLNFVVRGRTIVDWAALDLMIGSRDISTASLDIASHHVQDGLAQIEIQVSNTGDVPVGNFDLQFVWSANDVLGDSDDVLLAADAQSISGIPAHHTVTQSVTVQLNRAHLYALAVAADPAGQPVGTRSADSSRVYLLIDGGDTLSEVDEQNNSNQGLRIDSGRITYFPWDVNGSGVVTPVDAVAMIRAIGTFQVAEDLDGNGIVTPLEALAVLQRIGYERNPTAVEATSDLQVVSLLLGSATASPIEQTLTGPSRQPVRDPEDLFAANAAPIDDGRMGQSSPRTEPVPISDSVFAITEWLDVL